MTQELYWDEIFFTVNEPPAEFREVPLELASADLHYRGLSGDIEPAKNSPRIYDYSQTRHDPKWPPMRGKFTRYGDVRELLTHWDDKMVILGAGDELTVAFRPPVDPPPGWKRDFVWVSDGWTKDGNLNTRFSKTVLPLPAHDLKSYDRPPGSLADDPVYQRCPDDWKKYHTRYVTPAVFERGLRPPRRPDLP